MFLARPLFVRAPVLLLAFLALGVSARADKIEELTAIHLEAIGGRERVEALAALRATGVVIAGGRQMEFTLVAARPDRIRLETQQGGRTLVQGSDGREAPWEFDTGSWPPRYRDMAAATARTFVADAEFDDPLVTGANRGFTLEYGGEVQSDGRTLHRILVTRRLVDTYSVFLDADTFLIVRRVEPRKNTLGSAVQVVTHFADYRPVAGVLVAHRISVVVDGQTTQQTTIDAIVPNPATDAETFSRPRAVSVPQKKKRR